MELQVVSLPVYFNRRLITGTWTEKCYLSRTLSIPLYIRVLRYQDVNLPPIGIVYNNIDTTVWTRMYLKCTFWKKNFNGLMLLPANRKYVKEPVNILRRTVGSNTLLLKASNHSSPKYVSNILFGQWEKKNFHGKQITEAQRTIPKQLQYTFAQVRLAACIAVRNAIYQFHKCALVAAVGKCNVYPRSAGEWNDSNLQTNKNGCLSWKRAVCAWMRMAARGCQSNCSRIAPVSLWGRSRSILQRAAQLPKSLRKSVPTLQHLCPREIQYPRRSHS